jgi:hypothetical protein
MNIPDAFAWSHQKAVKTVKLKRPWKCVVSQTRAARAERGPGRRCPCARAAGCCPSLPPLREGPGPLRRDAVTEPRGPRPRGERTRRRGPGPLRERSAVGRGALFSGILRLAVFYGLFTGARTLGLLHSRPEAVTRCGLSRQEAAIDSASGRREKPGPAVMLHSRPEAVTSW